MLMKLSLEWTSPRRQIEKEGFDYYKEKAFFGPARGLGEEERGFISCRRIEKWEGEKGSERHTHTLPFPHIHVYKLAHTHFLSLSHTRTRTHSFPFSDTKTIWVISRVSSLAESTDISPKKKEGKFVEKRK
jgi:hypothetical protein